MEAITKRRSRSIRFLSVIPMKMGIQILHLLVRASISPPATDGFPLSSLRSQGLYYGGVGPRE